MVVSVPVIKVSGEYDQAKGIDEKGLQLLKFGNMIVI
jgi:hypothetical protein